MKKWFKTISLVLTLLLSMSSLSYASTIDSRDRYEFDKNDKFMQKYYESTKNANTLEEYNNSITAMGFVKDKEETVYYVKNNDKLLKTGTKKVTTKDGTKYYVNNLNVTAEEFTNTISSTYGNSELSMTLTTYRGTQIDQYQTDMLNLVYSFNWAGWKPYTDLFGCYWDDHDVYKTGSSYSSGLTSGGTTNTSRICNVSSSTSSGYISIMCKSRDGYVYDDHGAATTQYVHASGFPPNFTFGGSAGGVIFGISFSYSPQTTLIYNIDDFTY